MKPRRDCAADTPYRTRDEFARAYQSATSEESLLVTQMSQSWAHLEDMYQLRAHIVAKNGLLDLFDEDYDKLKTLARILSDAERMWRHAVAEFVRARRRTATARILQSILREHPGSSVSARAQAAIHTRNQRG